MPQQNKTDMSQVEYWKARCEIAEELLEFQDNPTYDPQYPNQARALWRHLVYKESQLTSIPDGSGILTENFEIIKKLTMNEPPNNSAMDNNGKCILEPCEMKILKECYNDLQIIRDRIYNLNEERFVELFEIEEQLTCAVTDLFYLI